MPLERRLDLKFIVLAAAFLAACSPLVTTAKAPTEASPRLSQPTASPSPTLYIAETENNTIIIAYLQLEQPGEGSEIASPLHVSAQVPAAAGVLRVELFGEDGRLMARHVVRTTGGPVELELAFDPAGGGENGRLALSLDDEFGRLQELISVEIILLTEGENKLVAGGLPSLLVIETPQAEDTVNGGVVKVSGLVSELASSLNIQLITREGRVLRSIDLRLAGSEGEEGTFGAELTYNPAAAAWVQVAVSLREAGIITEFKSVEVWLAP